jgi:mRNA interferase MazF
MVNAYIPQRGDIVWLNFSPQAGHEQQGKRPAIVISPKEYNEKVGLGIFCPITSKIKEYPFEVIIKTPQIQGAILADQIRNLDWKARDIQFVVRASDEIIAEVINKINVLIF